MSVASRALAAVGRCARAPLRARDLYVSRMAAFAGGGGGRGPVGLVAVLRSQSRGFYRSAADNDDLRELVRAAVRPAGVGPRSHSVAVGRIDEHRPCEFGPEDGALGPRSKSCAVGPTARTAASRVNWRGLA